MASAIWKVIERPYRTIFASTFTSRSRNAVVDAWLTAWGRVRVRRQLTSLQAVAWSCSRTVLAVNRHIAQVIDQVNPGGGVARLCLAALGQRRFGMDMCESLSLPGAAPRF